MQPLDHVPAVQPAYPACPYFPGDRIGDKYVLERLIGTGGMCTVWVAVHTGLDRKVALKFLRSDLPETEEGRLLREARALGRIEHPAVIRVFDYGETEAGHPYIVMELLDGSSLAHSLDTSGTLSPVAACRVLLPVIEGLAVAHESGIVHRDLKPENIFLARESGRVQPKLLDFGIAKFETRDPKPRLTMSGAVLGSPAYMAPEQARGQADVDHRSDVWAACVVLYEAVTGCTPFRGDNYNAVLRSIVEDDIPPLKERGGGEAAFWSVLSRGLVKRRDRRIQNVRELGDELCSFLLARGVDTDISGAPLVFSFQTVHEEQRHAMPPSETASAQLARTVPSGPAVAVVKGPSRRRRTAVLGLPLVAGVVAAAASLLVPRPFFASTPATRAMAETARESSVGVAAAVMRAADEVIDRTSELVSTDGEPVRPEPLSLEDLEQSKAESPPQRVSKQKAARSTTESERPKQTEAGLTTEDAVRALGLKTPYR